jgi:hypothetical protein
VRAGEWVVAVDRRDATERAKPRCVVLLEYHASAAQLAHRFFQVIDLEPPRPTRAARGRPDHTWASDQPRRDPAPAQDLAHARRFYAEKLGLEPDEERPGGLRYQCREGWFALFESSGRPSGEHTQMAVGLSNAKSQVGGELGFHHFGAVQFDRRAEVGEQPGARAEDDRCDVEVDAVDQSGVERLLDHAGAAHDVDLPLAGGGAGVVDCAFDAVGDEGDDRATSNLAGRRDAWVAAPALRSRRPGRH